MKENKKVLRVKSDSPVTALAGSIVKAIVDDGIDVELRAIGAASVSQATKAIGAASGTLATKTKILLAQVGFDETTIDGNKRTVIVFKLIVQ